MRPFEATFVAVVAAIVSLLCSYALERLLVRKRVLAFPNERSSHTVPTPVGGGLGMLGGLMSGALMPSLRATPSCTVLLAAVVALGMIGLWDDWSRMGVAWPFRLAAHVFVADMVAGTARNLAVLPRVIATNGLGATVSEVVAICWMVGLLNVVNFMDGIDGLAGSQLAISSAAIALVTTGTTQLLAVSCLGACLGFLCLNWAPARIFMGDAGSASFGFLIAASAVSGGGDWGTGHTAWDAMLFVGTTALFFVIDATATLLVRLVRGERIWQAHRQHLYQRMVRIGMGHGQVSTLYALGALGVSAMALMAWKRTMPLAACIGIVGSLVAYGSAWCWVKRREKERMAAVG